MQDKQGGTAETALEVKADSRRDQFFSTVGFGIVSTMYCHTALMTEILSEMKHPRPIIVPKRSDTDNRYTVPPTTVKRLTASQPTVNRPTENRPTMNQPTMNQPTVNQPTVYRLSINQSTVNQPTVNRTTDDRTTVYRTTD